MPGQNPSNKEIVVIFIAVLLASLITLAIDSAAIGARRPMKQPKPITPVALRFACLPAR